MRTSATAKTVENSTGIEQYDIAKLEKGARNEISKNISNMLMMQKSKDIKCKRGGEHMKKREEKKRKNLEEEGETMMEFEEGGSRMKKGEGESTSFNSAKKDEARKEKVLFKNGKLSLENNKVIKNNIENRIEKCFKRGYKGSCIISVRLKKERTGNRGNANYAKLIDLVVRKGWRPEEATKTGFKSAYLQYNEMGRANRIYKEMLRIEDTECNILDKNLEAWGVIQDWDDQVVHLAEAIDDKKYFNSLERITYRKYDKEVKDKKMKQLSQRTY